MKTALIFRVAVASTCALAFSPASALAAECTNPVLNPCINSDTLWVHPGASDFLAIRSTATAPRGEVGFGLVTTLQSRPIVLRVFSPGPPGTSQAAIDQQLTTHFLWHYGVTERLELNAALPITLSQDGAGLTPITAGASLPQVALRDARIGVGFALIRREERNALPSRVPFLPSQGSVSNGLGVGLRFDLSIPSGSADAFAGETGAVLAPAVVGDFRKGRFFAGSEVALRLRKTSELLGARVGSQLFAAVGAGFDILTNGLLSASAEVRMLPGFASQADVVLVGGRYQSQPNAAVAAPAEWTASLRTGALMGGDLSFQFGGGGALPLGPESGFGTPRFRLSFGVRYAPLGRDRDGDGIEDKFDACPDVFGSRTADATMLGCPEVARPPSTPPSLEFEQKSISILTTHRSILFPALTGTRHKI